MSSSRRPCCEHAIDPTPLQPINDRLQLLRRIGVVPSTCHRRNLDVLRGQPLFHDHLQRAERQVLRFCHRDVVIVAFLKIRLCAFGSRSDGLCLVLDVVPGRVCEVELRALVVEASDEQRRAERSGHLVLFSVLPEAQCEIARALGERLHSHGLVVHEAVILALDSRVVHQRPRVANQSTDGYADVRVDFQDLLHAFGLQQLRRQPLLHRKHDAL
mmetsp:Transcript_9726/g.36507  ORF Transcript_9726/g.36507 Transcript_9726/m.36507 type:complete len:215 (+) Transcript_9726:136-780(+)